MQVLTKQCFASFFIDKISKLGLSRCRFHHGRLSSRSPASLCLENLNLGQRWLWHRKMLLHPRYL